MKNVLFIPILFVSIFSFLQAEPARPATTAKKGRNVVTKGPPKGRNMVAPVPSPAEIEETNTIKNIEKYAASVPIINFEGDVVLLQFPDRLNGKTDYRHLHPNLVNQVVYERNTLDIDKEVIVLKSAEDHLESGKVKRVYVVLRKNVILTDRRLYYIAYLYLKDADHNQKGVHDFGNRKVSVEWDFWDHRGSDETTGTQLEYVFPCSTTIFIPCRSNETMDYPLPGKPNKANNDTQTKSKFRPNVNKPFIVEGGNVDLYKDYFNDLDTVVVQGRTMKFHFQSMADFGKPQPKKGGHYMGQVFNFLDADMKVFHNMIKSVVEAGMGLIKSFNGLFGGLGTPEAKTDEVIKSLVGVEDPEVLTETLTKAEMDELDDEVKLPSSGGLGGMINADESREAEEEGIIQAVHGDKKSVKSKKPSGRSLGVIQEDDLGYGTEVVQEGPYVKYGWRFDADAESENDPFVGFGACRYRKVKIEDIQKATTPQELVHVYQTALRTQCISKDAKLYQKMFDDGLIFVDTDKSFRLNVSSPILSQEKLQHKQRIELYRAVEIYLFSKMYVTELNRMSFKTVAPDSAPISRNIFTLGKAILNGLSMGSSNMPKQHCVKLARNMVKTLRRLSIKLVEDSMFIPARDKEVNFNDRVYLMGLMQYIMHAITLNEHDAPKTFATFYVKNRELLEDKIHLFQA